MWTRCLFCLVEIFIRRNFHGKPSIVNFLANCCSLKRFFDYLSFENCSLQQISVESMISQKISWPTVLIAYVIFTSQCKFYKYFNKISRVDRSIEKRFKTPRRNNKRKCLLFITPESTQTVKCLFFPVMTEFNYVTSIK